VKWQDDHSVVLPVTLPVVFYLFIVVKGEDDKTVTATSYLWPGMQSPCVFVWDSDYRIWKFWTSTVTPALNQTPTPTLGIIVWHNDRVLLKDDLRKILNSNKKCTVVYKQSLRCKINYADCNKIIQNYLWIWFCHTGPISLCVDSFVFVFVCCVFLFYTA